MKYTAHLIIIILMLYMYNSFEEIVKKRSFFVVMALTQRHILLIFYFFFHKCNLLGSKSIKSLISGVNPFRNFSFSDFNFKKAFTEDAIFHRRANQPSLICVYPFKAAAAAI